MENAMSTTNVLEQLRHLNNSERLLVIEAATRLIRDDLSRQPSLSKDEETRQMREAAKALQDLYRPGSEHTEWTVLDAEDFVDDYEPGRGLAGSA
jgi:hypothetical protein